jgi:shikimate kinase
LKGRGEARGAITIINAIAAGKGCAVGVELSTWAEVELSSGHGVEVHLEGLEGEPTSLVEMCASAVLERFSVKKNAALNIRSRIPVSRGLKSSSAAANATILATLDALKESMSPIEVLRMNADISIASGTSVTGAMDDAAASLLGGTVFTDNFARTLLKREEWALCPRVVINVPERMIRKQGLPRERIALFRPLMKEAFQLAWNGRYVDAMCLNSLCYGAALGLDQELVMRALEAGALGAGISGTGPAVAALVNKENERAVTAAMGSGSIAVDIYQGVPE